jgi:hypothetical protein
MGVVPTKQKQDFGNMAKYGSYGVLGKGTKSSARSDEMRIVGSQKEVRFELNCAKKGVLLPPKGDLPPLMEGYLFPLLCANFLKRGSF